MQPLLYKALMWWIKSEDMGWNLDDLHLEILISPEDDPWNRLLSSIPNSHILQTSYWAKVKSRVGWKANYLIWKDTEGIVQSGCPGLVEKHSHLQPNFPIPVLCIFLGDLF